jgi:hypothetical protein
MHVQDTAVGNASVSSADPHRTEYVVMIVYIVGNTLAGIICLSFWWVRKLSRDTTHTIEQTLGHQNSEDLALVARKMSVRRVFFETSVFLSLWFCQISRHTSVYHHIFSSIVFVIYTVLRISSFLDCLTAHLARMRLGGLSHHRIRFNAQDVIEMGILALAAVVAVSLLYRWVLLTFIDRFWFGFNQRHESAIVLWCVLVYIPVLLSLIFTKMIKIDKVTSASLIFAKDAISNKKTTSSGHLK